MELTKYDKEYIEGVTKQLTKEYEHLSDMANTNDDDTLLEASDHLSKAIKFLYQAAREQK